MRQKWGQATVRLGDRNIEREGEGRDRGGEGLREGVWEEEREEQGGEGRRNQSMRGHRGESRRRKEGNGEG